VVVEVCGVLGLILSMFFFLVWVKKLPLELMTHIMSRHRIEQSGENIEKSDDEFMNSFIYS
jgi:hypothetical protein